MFEKLAGRRPGFVDMDEWRDYAVTVPYLPERDTLLFEVRAAGVRQPGEVSFPGGLVEPGETMRAAAVRETCEELLVEAAQIELVAPLDKLHHLGSAIIHPFVANLKGYGGTFSTHEVQEVFEVPFGFFLSTPPAAYCNEISVTRTAENFPRDKVPRWPYPWAVGRNNVLFYEYEGKVIWGMTARIVRNLAELYLSGVDEI